MTTRKGAPKGKRSPKKPLSLYPLTVEEAAEAMLRVPPMPKDVKGPKAERSGNSRHEGDGHQEVSNY